MEQKCGHKPNALDTSSVTYKYCMCKVASKLNMHFGINLNTVLNIIITVKVYIPLISGTKQVTTAVI
jgi:hypothetical protein